MTKDEFIDYFGEEGAADMRQRIAAGRWAVLPCYNCDFDACLGWRFAMTDDLETCRFCGIKSDRVCDSPPPDTCDRALFHLDALKGTSNGNDSRPQANPASPADASVAAPGLRGPVQDESR